MHELPLSKQIRIEHHANQYLQKQLQQLQQPILGQNNSSDGSGINLDDLGIGDDSNIPDINDLIGLDGVNMPDMPDVDMDMDVDPDAISDLVESAFHFIGALFG